MLSKFPDTIIWPPQNIPLNYSIVPAQVMNSSHDGIRILPIMHTTLFYTLSGRIGKMVASHAAVARSILLRCTDLYYARGAQGVLPMRVGGATSQLDLPSLTPMSVACCG